MNIFSRTEANFHLCTKQRSFKQHKNNNFNNKLLGILFYILVLEVTKSTKIFVHAYDRSIKICLCCTKVVLSCVCLLQFLTVIWYTCFVLMHLSLNGMYYLNNMALYICQTIHLCICRHVFFLAFFSTFKFSLPYLVWLSYILVIKNLILIVM